MTRSLTITLLLLVSAVAAAVATAKPPARAPGDAIPWVDTLDAGMKQAATSRRPVFLVTLWGPGT
jgi:hypothetical protein